LDKASKTLIEGAKSDAKKTADDVVDKTFSAASDGATNVVVEVKIDSHRTGLHMFWSQTHGCLISEWHSFLNRVFDELVDYCLKQNKSDLVSKGLNINLKGADFSTLAKLRNSIAEALVEKFGLNNYTYRINALRKKLQINSEALKSSSAKLQNIEKLGKIVQKHVSVRNCLEHADSKVRIRDLNDAGCGGKEIPMIKNDGTKHKFVENDVISVSDKDVLELKETMFKYIDYFEVEL